MKEFSSIWNRSSSVKKQRKFVYNAPLHIRQKLVHAIMSEELRNKYGFRNLGVRKGDKVKIMRGQFRKQTGKVENVDLKKTEVYVEGAQTARKDGTKAYYALRPSSLMIIELNLDDKKRQKIIERKKKK